MVSERPMDPMRSYEHVRKGGYPKNRNHQYTLTSKFAKIQTVARTSSRNGPSLVLSAALTELSVFPR